MSLTRHKADAEDLVQSAITSAIAARTSFVVGTNFRAWMIRILRNRFLSNIRQRRFTVDLGDVPEGLLGRSGGQEGNLDIIELKRQMARLAPDHLLILNLISIEGLSYDEASERLGVAVGTLKCRVFRARAQLEAWMYGQEKSAGSAQSV
jgi:RNA polymerase sigma-70 factor (ECF subfamily)